LLDYLNQNVKIKGSLKLKRILSKEVGSYLDQEVILQGWVHNLRSIGDINFLILRDRTGLAQGVLNKEDIKPLEGLQLGTVISLKGKVVESVVSPGGYELHNTQINVITPVTEALSIPINKAEMKVNQPFFLDHAVIGHRHPKQQAVLRLSAAIMRGFRESLHARDFVEIQTPKFVSSATESGANVFAVNYFGKEVYLAQSPQFYKQIMVGVFERVYEVAPVFRAEKHATPRHLNEYVSLDVEFGFIENHFTVMEMLTFVMRGIIDYLKKECAPELELLEVELPILSETIPFLHFTDAQQLITDKYGVKNALGEPDLTPEHERLLSQWAKDKYNSDFLYITGYPLSKRPFYTHPDPERPGYTNGFDLLFRGLELVTGGQRLHKYEDYIKAAEKQGYTPELFEPYFEAFKHGMPPHGGFAIGLERFLMQLLYVDNIRMVTLFPRDINRLIP
jgi:nondiscriminating aspartyl-tRNA synthetase